jgi:hypothetical protein
MVSAELTPLIFFGVVLSEAEPDAEADADYFIVPHA